jgi:hypothetical protein
MHVPEGGAPSQMVVDQCVLQQVVTHVEGVVQAAQAIDRRAAALGTTPEHPKAP